MPFTYVVYYYPGKTYINIKIIRIETREINHKFEKYRRNIHKLSY